MSSDDLEGALHVLVERIRYQSREKLHGDAAMIAKLVGSLNAALACVKQMN